MKIETQPMENHQVRLIAELDQDLMESYKRRAARKISQETRIPGFRPGKAPYDVIRRLYGEESIEKQAISMLVDDTYPKMLEESGIKPSAPGSLDDILSTNPPKLAFTIPLEPTVELCDYHAIRKTYQPEPVSEEEVQKALDNLQLAYGTAEPVSRPAQIGDLVYIKLSGQLTEEAQEEEEREVIKERPYQLIIEEEDEETAWPFKGFSKELIGLAADEGKTIIYQYPDNSPFEKLRGKEVEFLVTVQSVKEIKKPALDDEFAKSTGEYQSLEEMLSSLRSNMEANRLREYDNKYFSELVDEIASQSTIKYPPVLLEQQTEELLESFIENLEERHIELNTFLKANKIDRETFIEKQIRPAAKKQLEHSLVLDKIGEQEKIDIDRETLVKETTQTLQRFTDMPGFQSPKSSSERQRMVDVVFRNTAERLMNQQILDRLKAIATGQFKSDEIENSVPLPEENPVADQTAAEPSQTADEKPVPAKKRSASKKKEI